MGAVNLTRGHALVLGLLALAGLLFFGAAARNSPGGSVKIPAFQVPPKWPAFTPPPGVPVLGPDQHVGGYVFTPHRYPPAAGNDISVLIHRGYGTMFLPAAGDLTWLSLPPSEGEL